MIPALAPTLYITAMPRAADRPLAIPVALQPAPRAQPARREVPSSHADRAAARASDRPVPLLAARESAPPRPR